MNNLQIKQAIRKSTERAIIAKMPERTIISVERCAVLLELFYFEWKNYKDALSMKIEFSEIEQHLNIIGPLNKGQKKMMEKCANDYKDEVNKTANQLERLLKMQLSVFDKLPEHRMEELEQISNNIFNAMSEQLKQK